MILCSRKECITDEDYVVLLVALREGLTSLKITKCKIKRGKLFWVY